MRSILIAFISLLLAVTSVRSAKYAGETFSLGVSARALAMGGAAVAGPFDASAGYWNPAGLNLVDGRNIIAMHAETFGSLLNHDFIAYTYNNPGAPGRVRAYGFYFYYLGGGGIKITDFNPATQRPYVVREESHGDYLLAGSLAGRIIDKFEVGLTARIIYRDLGTVTGYGLTVDIGGLYQIKKYARIGLMVTDLTSGFIRYSGGNTESILPTVKPGLLLTHSYRDFTGRLAFSGDIKFEGIHEAAQFWMGEISLDTHWGAELSYREMLFGRAGFDIGNFTGGIGIDIRRIKIDLAYLHNSELDETFRISAGYSF
nr:PorV/PorQ family protein [candidate division Zixibacteria bacterium]